MQLPSEFIEKYTRLLGEEAQDFFDSFDQKVKKGFRVNPLKFDGELYDHSLEQPIAGSQWGYYGQVSGKSIDHQSGLIYSQEPSAMLVGQIANVKPGQKVLDLCAAPGGKTTYLASSMQQSGVLVTNEINRGRAKILAENVERFGMQNAFVLNESPDRLEDRFVNFFDVIVVDAPCSGEGMFRKDPAAMEYWHKDYPAECANRQKHILDSAIKMLAPEGKLIYSTCTFAPEEDEQIIAWMLDKYSELEMNEIDKTADMDDGRPQWADGNPELKKAVRLFPHHYDGEGHFIAKMTYHGENAENKTIYDRSVSKLDRNQLQLWEEFTKEFLVDSKYFASDHLFLQKDRLYYQSEPLNLDGLHFIKPGLELGVFKKGRFEPSLALVLALNPTDVKHVVEVTREQWKQYVHGDTFHNDSDYKGWVAVKYKNVLIGPGKLVQGTVKNFYPKGLRINF